MILCSYLSPCDPLYAPVRTPACQQPPLDSQEQEAHLPGGLHSVMASHCGTAVTFIWNITIYLTNVCTTKGSKFLWSLTLLPTCWICGVSCCHAGPVFTSHNLVQALLIFLQLYTRVLHNLSIISYSAIIILNWSERSACAARGCWHKRSGPYCWHYFSLFFSLLSKVLTFLPERRQLGFQNFAWAPELPIE